MPPRNASNPTATSEKGVARLPWRGWVEGKGKKLWGHNPGPGSDSIDVKATILRQPLFHDVEFSHGFRRFLV